MGKSAPSQPTQQNVRTETSNLPEYARPYFENLMNRAQAISNQEYTPYPYERIAGFTPAQQQVQQRVLGLGSPNQFALGSALAGAAGQASLRAADYGPGQFNAQQIRMPGLQQFQMDAAQTGFRPDLTAFQMGNVPQVEAAGFGPVRDVAAQRVYAPNMNAAQTQWQANLERFQMAAPDKFTGATAQQYMSPFMQNVLDVQKREAIRDAQRQQVVQDLGAARQGTYGGSRQLLAGLERERNLGTQLGDIQARGQQAAYESAQSQFERDRAAQMAAQQANLQAALGVQELGTTTGLQAALANLSNEQQARVNNQAMAFQAQGMNAENALKAALANQGVDVTRAQANQQAQMQAQLANQQAGLTAGQQNLAAQLGVQQLGTQTGLQAALANLDAASQARQQNLAAQLGVQQLGTQTGLQAALANQQQALEAQRLAEQSRQFGQQNRLAAYGQAGQMGQTLGNLGQYQQQADLSRLQAQQAAAAQTQALEQQRLDQMYADFLRQRDYPMEQLGYFSNMLRGLPVQLSSTQTTYGQPPSMASQILGAGLGGLGLYNTMRGG